MPCNCLLCELMAMTILGRVDCQRTLYLPLYSWLLYIDKMETKAHYSRGLIGHANNTTEVHRLTLYVASHRPKHAWS